MGKLVVISSSIVIVTARVKDRTHRRECAVAAEPILHKQHGPQRQHAKSRRSGSLEPRGGDGQTPGFSSPSQDVGDLESRVILGSVECSSGGRLVSATSKSPARLVVLHVAGVILFVLVPALLSTMNTSTCSRALALCFTGCTTTAILGFR